MSGLVLALLGFSVGTIALQWQPELVDPGWCVAIGGGLALLAALTHLGMWPHATHADSLSVGKPQASDHPATPARIVVRALVCASFVATGFGYASWRAQVRLADALPEAWEAVDVAVVGVIDELPSASPRGTRFAFTVERVLTPGATVPERISLAWFATGRDSVGDVPAVRAGERWRLTVRLKRPHGTVNPHGFDLEAWLLENGFRASGYVRGDPANARVHAFAGRPGDYIQRARENVRDRALSALRDAPYAGVIVALAIGEQRAIPESQWLVFNRTGITHLVSISGLHVTVFASLAAGLTFALARRRVWLTTRMPARRVAAAVGAAAAFGYVLLAGAQVPAQRTFIMLAVAAVGLWLGRPGTARIVWLWALATVLAFDPWAALTPGFWLSFGAVGLLLYSGTGRLRSAVRSRRDALKRALAQTAHAQVVVTVGLVPLTLAVFQQVSIVAPVANAIAIPVVTFMVVPLALSGIALPIDLPWQAAHAVFALLMVPLEGLAALPGRTWEQHAPMPWTLFAAMAGVVWLLAPRGTPARALGLVWLLPLFTERPAPPAPGAVRITTLDVGQGLAVVVETHAHALLYDTGPRFNDDADAGGRIVSPFLRAAGIGRLHVLLVSHLDTDHSGGTASVVQTLEVDRVLTSVAASHAMFHSARAPPDRCVAGQEWTWDGVRFRVLHPPPEWYVAADAPPAQPVGRVRSNDLSCVLRIDAGTRAAILTGDIEARSEAALIADRTLTRADVLLVPHHGSRTSSTPAFVDAVAPELGVIATGYRNRFGHPRADVVLRYVERDIALARTDLDGAVIVELGPEAEFRRTAQREVDRRYWYDVPQIAGDEDGASTGIPARASYSDTTPPASTPAVAGQAIAPPIGKDDHR